MQLNSVRMLFSSDSVSTGKSIILLNINVLLNPISIRNAIIVRKNKAELKNTCQLVALGRFQVSKICESLGKTLKKFRFVYL